jgi:sec-independent protein translocase protein TatA
LPNKQLQLNDYICFKEVKIERKMYTGTLVEFLNMGGGEIMLILAVVLLLFGGKKLPELARGLGKGLRDFKDASEGVKREIHRNINSVGITDEIDDFKSALNDDDNSRHHPYEYKPEENTYPETDKEPINFNKEEAVANNGHHENVEHIESVESSNSSRIETDKTKL